MIRLFRVFIPSSVLGLLLSEFVLIYLCYVAAPFLLNEFVNPDFDAQFFLFSDNGLYRIALIVVCIMAGIYFHNLYAHLRVRSRMLLLQQLCLVVGIAFLTQALLTYLKRPEWTVPKWVMIFGSLLTLMLLPAWRVFYASVVLEALGFQRLLFLGTSPIVQEIAAYLPDHPEIGLTTIGYLDDIDPSTKLPGGRLLGRVEDLHAVVREYSPDRIVVGMSERRRRLPVQELLDLRFSGIHIEEAYRAYEVTFCRVCTRELRPSQLISRPNWGPEDSAFSGILSTPS